MDRIMVKALFAHWAEVMKANVDYLTRLDGVAGDSDIGIVMSDGFIAVNEVVSKSDEIDVGNLLFLAGKTLSKVAPSSMGTLLAMGLMNAGKNLKGFSNLNGEGIAILLDGIATGVMKIGKANEGEKTFLDAILPAARAAKENRDLPTGEITERAAQAAEAGFHAATMRVAKHGRIAFRGENSIGIEDPGAAVAMLLVKGLNEVTRTQTVQGIQK